VTPALPRFCCGQRLLAVTTPVQVPVRVPTCSWWSACPGTRARWCASSFPLIAGVRQRSRSPALSLADTSSTLQIFGELWKGPQLVPVRTPPIRWYFRTGRLQARGAQAHRVGPQVRREISLLVMWFNNVLFGPRTAAGRPTANTSSPPRGTARASSGTSRGRLRTLRQRTSCACIPSRLSQAWR
jgi:hypothetical protein